jgi:hypothetical protein
LSLSRRLKKIFWQSYTVLKRGIPKMLLKLEEVLGAMYKKFRGVLQRG